MNHAVQLNHSGVVAGGWEARGVFAANIAFLKRALREGHVTSDPNAAALFVVPVMLSQVTTHY